MHFHIFTEIWIFWWGWRWIVQHWWFAISKKFGKICLRLLIFWVRVLKLLWDNSSVDLNFWLIYLVWSRIMDLWFSLLTISSENRGWGCLLDAVLFRRINWLNCSSFFNNCRGWGLSITLKAKKFNCMLDFLLHWLNLL